METKTKILTPLLLLCAGICIGMMLMRSCSLKQTEIIQTDSTIVVKYDTIIHYKPVPVKTTITGEYSFYKFKPYAFFTDTVETVIYEQGQTFYHEIKEYKDSTYYAKISGINAFLEQIDVYPKTVTKYVTSTITKEPNKWLLSVATEYESLGEKNFVRAGGKMQYQDKGNRFSFEGGNEILSKEWYFKFKYERDILGW